MNGEVGIGIASPRGSMEDSNWSWDSRKKKMSVDVNSKPPHLDLIEIDGGTIWTVGSNQRREEVILEIEHGLLFKPKVLSYFYLYDAPANMVGLLGSHSANIAWMVFNDVAGGSEWLATEVDEKYLRVRHIAVGGLNGRTMLGRTMKFRYRYEITNLRDMTARPEWAT